MNAERPRRGCKKLALAFARLHDRTSSGRARCRHQPGLSTSGSTSSNSRRLGATCVRGRESNCLEMRHISGPFRVQLSRAKARASSTPRPRSPASWPALIGVAAPPLRPDHPRPCLRLRLPAAQGPRPRSGARTDSISRIYGQEMDNATKALARMNMILHDCPTAEIWQDNSLSSPHSPRPTEPSRPSISSWRIRLLHQGMEQRLRSGK